METRAVEESFSWTPQSRKAFLREVPLLSSRAEPAPEKTQQDQRKLARGRGGGGGGGGGRGERGGRGGRGLGRDFGAPLPQTAQIHWRRRNFTAGPWGSFMGSHRGRGNPNTGPGLCLALFRTVWASTESRRRTTSNPEAPKPTKTLNPKTLNPKP